MCPNQRQLSTSLFICGCCYLKKIHSFGIISSLDSILFFFSSVVYIIDFTIQDCKEKSGTRTSFSCLDISLEIPGDYSNLVTDRTLIVVLPEMAQQDVKCASGVIEPLDAVVLLVCASPVRLCAFCNWVIVVVTTILSALFRLLSFCDTTGIY